MAEAETQQEIEFEENAEEAKEAKVEVDFSDQKQPVVEVVDEQPEQKDTDELEQYSEGVKKRINKLTAKMRESERREQAALVFAEATKQELDNLRRNANTLDTAISYTDATASAGQVAITINQHSYSAAMVEDLTQVQSSYDLVKTFGERMGAALALKVDDYLEDLINTALDDSGSLDGLTVDGGGTDAAVDQAGIATIVTAAMTEDGNLSNWMLLLNSSAYGKLFAVDEFVTAYNVGNPQGGVAPSMINGEVGMLAGMKVIHSNNVQSSFTNGSSSVDIGGYLLHKSCLNYAFSIKPRVQTQYDIDHLSTKIVADVAYGGACKGSTTAGEKTAFAII